MNSFEIAPAYVIGGFLQLDLNFFDAAGVTALRGDTVVREFDL